MQISMRFLLLCVVLMFVGCSPVPKLMPTPNIYADGGSYPQSDVPPELQNTEIDLLFVTDRAPETSTEGELRYGTRRSASVGFGSAIVEIGNGLTWQQLVELSETSKRTSSTAIRVNSVSELGRFPPTPHLDEIVEHISAGGAC